MAVRLIFPNQLFPNVLENYGETLVLVEHPLFFSAHNYHAQKLMLHAVSMRLFAERLQDAGHTASVVALENCRTPEAWADALRPFCRPGDRLLCYDLVDDRLEQEVCALADALGIPLVIEDSPSFLTGRAALADYRNQHPNAVRMVDFYAWQRRRLNVLLTPQGKPAGGAWSFDTENRKRLPKNAAPPEKEPLVYDAHETELLEQAAARFQNSPGTAAGFNHPVTPEQAEYALDCFLVSRFDLFGDYEDALEENLTTLYHSRLSAALNCGLLNPAMVVARALAAAREDGVPLNSVEGFVRQVIGWREFIRASYVWFGPEMREANALQHTHPLPPGFWEAETGLRPVDAAIRRVLAQAYTHHIERLMVLGCFLLLQETEPDAVHDWFMALFIDAYDWVMVPNVYAMSQYAHGGSITTKPYFCGSSYLRKMSHYPKEPWTETWDGLYWRFVHRHRTLLLSEPRLRFAVDTYDRFSDERKAALEQAAAGGPQRKKEDTNQEDTNAAQTALFDIPAAAVPAAADPFGGGADAHEPRL